MAWQWTEKKLQAAHEVAQDILSNQQIADKVDVCRRTLDKWKATPAFQAKVEEIVQETARQLQKQGLAAKQNRLAGYQERWDKLNQIITERAAFYSQQPQLAAPGAGTGLLTHTRKCIGGGQFGEFLDEYALDAGLLAALLALEKQAAQEVGDWADILQLDFSKIPQEDLEKIAR